MPSSKRQGSKNHSHVKYKKLDQSIGDHTVEMEIGEESSTTFWKAIFRKPLGWIDFISSNFLRLTFYMYWCATGHRLPMFLVYYGLSAERIDQLDRWNTEKEEQIARLNDEIRDLKYEADKQNHELKRFKEENAKLETEKHDALRRLSEIASAKLRDNNPNIADLNDQCRPTKLAEMFSELYDNEWTNAYSKLEDGFGAQRAIGTLLQIVMEAYGYCEERVSGPWNVLMEWFIDMRSPDAQKTLKWLKDSRKAKIREKVPAVGAEYEKKLEQILQENKLIELLSVSEMREYITKTVELCLLMVTADPPVVLSCPGWSSDQREQEAAGNQPIDQKEDNKTEDVNNEDKGKTHFGRIKNEMEPFNKDLFKEYTKCGPYLDFPVWPVLYLHKNGPILSKGIAQGKKDPHQDKEPIPKSKEDAVYKSDE